MLRIIGSLVSLVVGAIIASVTIVGVVSNSVDTTAKNKGDVTAPVIDYGSNG